MAETYVTGGRGSTDTSCVDDHFFRRYRELLDAEDTAFDELEHAYEDGDRATFESDLVAWRSAIVRRESFLENHALSASFLPV
jgi:nitroreductase